MVKGLYIILSTFFFVTILSITVYSAELINEEDLGDVSGQAGLTITFNDFVLTHEADHMAIGGDDGLGIPEAPDGAWFVLDSTRIITLNLSDATIDFDCVTIDRSNTSINDRLHDALFADIAVTNKTVAVINFGEANFYTFSNDSIMTLSFGNNKEGRKSSDPEVTEPNLFTEEIAQFQVDGSAMTVQSEDAKMYVFAHTGNGFDVDGQLP